MNYQILRKRSCINLGVLAVHNDAFYFSQLKEQMLNIVMNLKSYSCCLKLPTFHSVIPMGDWQLEFLRKEKIYILLTWTSSLFHFLFVIPESGKRVHFFLFCFFGIVFFFFFYFFHYFHFSHIIFYLFLKQIAHSSSISTKVSFIFLLGKNG